MNISRLSVILSAMATVSISACSTTPSNTNTQTLQQIQNIEAYPESKNNKATLSKASDRCIIQFTGYFTGGESTETWQFQGNNLIQASSKTTHYAMSTLQPDTKTLQDTPDQNSTSSVNFDIQNIDVKNNFNKLTSHFSQQALAQCV